MIPHADVPGSAGTSPAGSLRHVEADGAVRDDGVTVERAGNAGEYADTLPHPGLQVSALLLFCNNLIGLTFGNLAVGWLNDHALDGSMGVRLSVPVVVGGAALFTIPFLIAGRRPFALYVEGDGR